jgi:hypothetical protein
MRLVNIASGVVIARGIIGASLETICRIRKLNVAEYKLEPETELEAKLSAQSSIMSSMKPLRDKATVAMSLLGDAADGATISLLLFAFLVKALNNSAEDNPIKVEFKNNINTFFNDENAFSDLVTAYNAMLTGVTADTIKLPFKVKYGNIKDALIEINDLNTVVSNALINNAFNTN